jgi:epoxyqueuosine reductase QueG
MAAQLLLRKTEEVSLALSYWLEERGCHAFQVATEETDPALKRGSYGWLSLRHLGVEAGMGTLGLEVNLLTPEFGPRVYQGAVLVDVELEPDARITDQLCIGESCGRCLYACPTNAVLHWGLDKRLCGEAAQPDGIASIVYGPLRALAEAQNAETSAGAALAGDAPEVGSDRRLSTSYAACPRCLEVCPVGGTSSTSPRSTARSREGRARIEKLRDMTDAAGGGRTHRSTRWIGEDGYKGLRRERGEP